MSHFFRKKREWVAPSPGKPLALAEDASFAYYQRLGIKPHKVVRASRIIYFSMGLVTAAFIGSILIDVFDVWEKELKVHDLRNKIEKLERTEKLLMSKS